jgi:hypothetical protein
MALKSSMTDTLIVSFLYQVRVATGSATAAPFSVLGFRFSIERMRPLRRAPESKIEN